jgi:hypothetical protein
VVCSGLAPWRAIWTDPGFEVDKPSPLSPPRLARGGGILQQYSAALPALFIDLQCSWSLRRSQKTGEANRVEESLARTRAEQSCEAGHTTASCMASTPRNLADCANIPNAPAQTLSGDQVRVQSPISLLQTQQDRDRWTDSLVVSPWDHGSAEE